MADMQNDMADMRKIEFMDHEAKAVQDKCGLIGLAGRAANFDLLVAGLISLQHRGRTGFGVVAFDGFEWAYYHSLGLVRENMQAADASLTHREYLSILGHVRYATSGSNAVENLQPLMRESKFGKLSLAHNGQITSFRKHSSNSECGYGEATESDTEMVFEILEASCEETLTGALSDLFNHIDGAFSMIVQHVGGLIGIRDPLGIRPLVIGKTSENYVLASETCALDAIGANYVGEVQPGELVEVVNNKLTRKTIKSVPDSKRRFCAFEFVYFSDPSSTHAGVNVASTRYQAGRALHLHAPISADVVVPVPNSGIPAARGLSDASGIAYTPAISLYADVGRTFIGDDAAERIRLVGSKFALNADAVNGLRILLVDDSLVRGNTMKLLVERLRAAGAAEVHLRIASPPFLFPCYFGIDVPSQSELIAPNRSENEIAEIVGASSLSYLSVESLAQILSKNSKAGCCFSCFTGLYPNFFERK